MRVTGGQGASAPRAASFVSFPGVMGTGLGSFGSLMVQSHTTHDVRWVIKKSELERQRQSFSIPTRVSTDNLRARVSRDLNVVKDAYDTGSAALTELAKLVSLSSGSLNPKDLAHLAKAYADISRTLIALRDEGRTTIREAARGGEGTADAVTPPSPDEALDAPSLPDPAKISSPRATPVALGDYLNTLKDSDHDT